MGGAITWLPWRARVRRKSWCNATRRRPAWRTDAWPCSSRVLPAGSNRRSCPGLRWPATVRATVRQRSLAPGRRPRPPRSPDSGRARSCRHNHTRVFWCSSAHGSATRDGDSASASPDRIFCFAARASYIHRILKGWKDIPGRRKSEVASTDQIGATQGTKMKFHIGQI
jgi:hypothetical protein